MHYNHLGLQIRLVDAVFQELLRQFSGVTTTRCSLRLLRPRYRWIYLKNWRQKWRSMNSKGFEMMMMKNYQMGPNHLLQNEAVLKEPV